MIRQVSKSFDLKKVEEKYSQWWREHNIYQKQKEKNLSGKKFYFLDGPPYASGAIHLGTAWNKILKDAILRYFAMQGYNVHRQPGWDCHGLPIEVKVEKELGIKNKREIEQDVEGFVKACKNWALKHVKIMEEQFKKLGVWMDWDNAYLTLKDEYIESAWWTIKKAHEKGLLTKDLRVVSWCPRCETALAEAELEYGDRTDPSIYVKFPVVGRENEYILIWTTTPWTLIGNLAVMVHPEYEYVRAKTKQGVLILAKDLVSILKDKFGLEYEILEVFKGRDLEGLKYENPLKDYIKLKAPENAYQVILADFVTLGEGTGCVHSAPGHGPEDFEACSKYGIPAICPVDESGTFKEEAGKYAGMKAKKDDRVIIMDLNKKGMLLKAEQITHRYAHCWRCKSPILYRATEQWFIKITQVKQKMLQEIERVEWKPEWAGSARFSDWISNAKDWTISRQRYWGIPLPVWQCNRCSSIRVVGSREELGNVEELHRPYVDRIKLSCSCGGEMHRVKDVLDVWFDSGVAAWASLGYPAKDEDFKKLYPADLIIEGHDQTRGWFYSLLGCGMLAFDEVPYRRVLMHGFTLDEKGEKMSKSLGNVVAPEEVVERYSVDVLRFYVLWANKPWDDLKFNWKEIEVINKMFNILWNTLVFATTYMSIDNFTPEKVPPNLRKYCKAEDKWILSRLHSTIKEVNQAMQELHPYIATRAIYNFVVEDLSRWYIPLIRPRTWVEKESIEKIVAYSVLYRVFCYLARLLAPFAPHLAEEIYQSFVTGFDIGEESVHLDRFPRAEDAYIDKELEKNMEIAREVVEAVLSARDQAKLKRRWPATKIIIYPEDEEVKRAVESMAELIKRQANTLKIEVAEPEEKPVSELRAVPNFSTLGPEFKALAKKIAEYIISENPEKLREKIQRGEAVDIEGESVILKPEHVKFEERMPENMYAVQFSRGAVVLNAEITPEVKRIGYSREIVRRIQEMRKELNLDIEAFIRAGVAGDSEIISYAKENSEYIAGETRAKELTFGKADYSYTKTWKIAGKEVKIGIEPIEA